MSDPYALGFPGKACEAEFGRYMDRLDEKSCRRVRDRIKELGRTPRPSGGSFTVLRPPVTVRSYSAPYRLRIGDHRVLYDVDDAARKVILIAIRRRSESTYRE